MPMMKLILIIIMVASLASCRAGPPWMKWRFDGPPPGKEYTPLYVEGWKDGCETGTAVSATSFYKFFHNFKQDAIKAQNRVYYKGWKDAYDFCQRYLYQYNRRAFV